MCRPLFASVDLAHLDARSSIRWGCTRCTRHTAVLRSQTKTRSCVRLFMDVRCEKCQTEYELDEARLKPGGVTVKCTNCGHMFRIRKRTITNVGAPPVPRDPNGTARPRTGSSKQPLGGAPG